jgi:GDP/UDP-N,N'-diacetylbacillosamine 2-epimerase (hydrolysing)
MQFVDGVVGNSSSGLAEAPSMGIGTIDIGDRQRGRLRSTSVIHCEPSHDQITQALRTLYSSPFKASLGQVVNPYGTGGASQRIVEVLAAHPLDKLIKKKFHDTPPT